MQQLLSFKHPQDKNSGLLLGMYTFSFCENYYGLKLLKLYRDFTKLVSEMLPHTPFKKASKTLTNTLV